jgi:hypothetical protein
VGYAFVRQSRIVELVTVPEQSEAARHLAARVCADACEHGDGHLRCDLAHEHPLHGLLERAGGKRIACRESNGEVFMAKLLDPLAVLRHLLDDLAARARMAELSPGAELGIEVRCGSEPRWGARKRQSSKSGVVERYVLQVGKRSLAVQTGGPCRHTIIVREGDLAALVLGDENAMDLEAARRLRCTTSAAKSLAYCLFPARMWWRPALDDLLA